jgi:putative transposase
VVSVQGRRQRVRYALTRGLSQRRACTLFNTSRSSLKYEHRMPMRDAPIIQQMKALSGRYPRFGSRRIRVFLERLGTKIGKERCARIWAQAKLQVPRKRSRKLKGKRRQPLPATGRNAVWSYDFVHDACANGQKVKCLTVIDEYTRECLAIEVSASIRSSKVIEVLEKLMCVHGMPRTVRSDNGPEFISNALLRWVQTRKLDLHLIEPGKPWQNGTNESFNGKFRDECLAMEWFRNRTEAKVVIEDWRVHYNTVRPHSSLEYKTPFEFRMNISDSSTIGAQISMC